MTPDKDPQNYSVLAYLAFGGLSVWGGLVTYIQTVKREGRKFRWAEAVFPTPVGVFPLGTDNGHPLRSLPHARGGVSATEMTDRIAL